MKQSKKLDGVVSRLWSASSQVLRVSITQILILVLCFGPVLSLDLAVKDSANTKPVPAPARRGPVATRKPKPIFAAPVQTATVLAGLAPFLS